MLNKVDLVDQDAVERLERRVRDVNPTASVHRTSRAAIDLKFVIGVDAYATKPFISEPFEEYHDVHEHPHGTRGHARTSHEGVSSIQLHCPVLTAERTGLLDEWIRMALWEGVVVDADGKKHTVEVLRCKGLYAVEGGQQFVLQGVRNLYEVVPCKGNEPSELEEGKLVFIGRGMDDYVRTSLCRVLYD